MDGFTGSYNSYIAEFSAARYVEITNGEKSCYFRCMTQVVEG